MLAANSPSYGKAQNLAEQAPLVDVTCGHFLLPVCAHTCTWPQYATTVEPHQSGPLKSGYLHIQNTNCGPKYCICMLTNT